MARPAAPRSLTPGGGQPLADILADMLRAALAWESEHGAVASDPEWNHPSNLVELTGIPPCIHSADPDNDRAA